MAFDPAQKRIQVFDRTRQPPKVLDSCSSSQIHLWSQCQIVRRRARRDARARRTSERGKTFRPTSRPRLRPPSQT